MTKTHTILGHDMKVAKSISLKVNTCRYIKIILFIMLVAGIIYSECLEPIEASAATPGKKYGILADLVSGNITQAETISISWYEQLLVIISGCVIKPTYMVLSFILILFLRKKKEKDLVLINLGLITFLVGELFCAINFLLAGGENDLFETLHGLGMVGLWIFLPWGIIRLLDERVIFFTDSTKRCAMSSLCHKCWKTQNVICGINRILPYAAISLALLALMPITAPVKPFKIIMTINDTPTIFSFSPMVLFFELRLYAVLGSIFLLYSGIILKFRNNKFNISEIFFFIGFGFMFYSLFRFVLLACYDGIPQWMNFWEEFSELIMISLLSYFLFIFRKQFKIQI